MLHQNVFDPILLVGSADKLIPSDCHEGKHHKPYPIVGRHVLGKKRSPHLWSLEAHPLFSLSEFFFPISLYLTTYSVGIQSLWPQIHTRFDWWMIKHQTWVWNFCLRVFCVFFFILTFFLSPLSSPNQYLFQSMFWCQHKTLHQAETF